jgi:uncharacterized Zn finger protein
VVRRGDVLLAEVQGSDYAPYRVHVTLGGTGVADAQCSCPYGIEWSGWCKHITAVLLVAARDPDEIEEQPPIEARLAALNADALRRLLVRLVEAQPTLYDLATAMIAAEVAASAPSSSTTPPTVSVDPRDVRRRVRGTLRSLDRMRPSEAYWHTGSVVRSIEAEVLTEARAFLDAGQGHNAIAVLEALTDEYVDSWTDYDDSNGEFGDFFDDIGAAWTEAVLTTELTTAERNRLAARLDEWEEQVQDYGVDAPFYLAGRAAIEGWDEPHLLWVLSGEGDPPDDAEWYEEELVEPRLAILERQGRLQEALRLAETEDRTARRVALLAKLGRIGEAVAVGLKELNSAADSLYVARRLHELGAIDEAVRIGEHGLNLGPTGFTEEDDDDDSRPYARVTRGRGELAAWLRDLAAGRGRSDTALRAAAIAFEELPGLASYRRTEELAGDRWQQFRARLLDHLRQRRPFEPSGAVDVFLHEHLLEDALNFVEQSWDDDLIARVAEAAAQAHPDRVIAICRARAERIMDGGKADRHHHAADWLRRARTAFRAARREDEWRTYLEEQISRHQRKYKLRPLLEKLRTG